MAEENKSSWNWSTDYIRYNCAERDSDTISYLIDIGYSDPTYELGSKGSIRREENILMRERIPEMWSFLKNRKMHVKTMTLSQINMEKILREKKLVC